MRSWFCFVCSYMMLFTICKLNPKIQDFLTLFILNDSNLKQNSKNKILVKLHQNRTKSCNSLKITGFYRILSIFCIWVNFDPGSSIDLSFSILSHHGLFTIHPIQNELYLTRLPLPFNPSSFHGGNDEINEDESVYMTWIIHIIGDFFFIYMIASSLCL